MKPISIILSISLLTLISMTARAAYDPMHTSSDAALEALNLSVHDSSRSRDIPIRVYFPQTSIAAPTILFSPGLGGSRYGYAYLAKHWAKRGYVVIVLQHPGSDDQVWQGKTKSQAIAAMHRAASGRNFLLRIQDVKCVLDYLRDNNTPLAARVDLSRIGMAGHSFGAVTTEAVSGEQFRGRALFTDPRIKAALMLSPSSPRHGSAETAFSQVNIPWMLMTGTKDIGPLGLGAQTVDSRLAVYNALPPGNKYELILANAQHMAFSDRPFPSSQPPRNPNDHRAILALSTAFWDASLRHSAEAQDWLDSEAKTVLKPGDQWKEK